MKKISSILLTFVLLYSCSILPIFAQETKIKGYQGIIEVGGGIYMF